MNDLGDLYREVILDHNRNPRNFGELSEADRVIEGVNPLCGDKMTLYVKLKGDRIEDIAFKGSGCAISVASSSLMTERVRGMKIEDVEKLFTEVHDMLMGTDSEAPEKLDKLAALSGVREFPSRVKCASMGWHALHAALTSKDEKAVVE